MRLLVILCAAAVIVWWFFGERTVELTPGVLVTEKPLQETIGRESSFELNGYTITPLATFELTAKVLAKKHYSFGREADLSPVDFALGWQKMSDQAVINAMSISQSGRWYRYRYEPSLISATDIRNNSANMHLIPADSSTESQLESVRTGQLIKLSGKLVRAEASDGWRWVSSLTRNDSGQGACELFYVERVKLPADPLDPTL